MPSATQADGTEVAGTGIDGAGIDWTAFDAALRRGDQRAELLADLRRVEGWLAAEDSAADEGAAAFRAATATLDAARPLYRALMLVRGRQLREPNATPVDVAARAAEWVTALVQTHPDVVVRVTPPAELAAHAAFDALHARLAPAVAACGLGVVTAEHLDALDAVVGELDAFAATLAADVPLRPYVDHARGHGALSLADGAALLGDADRAFPAYARAADAFAAAGDPARAAACRGRAAALRSRVGADLDADAARALAALVDAPADADPDPFARAAALGEAIRQNCAAGDYFEAARAADEAVAVLAGARVADPEAAGVAAAAAGLFAAAGARAGAGQFFTLCSQVMTAWAAVAQARAAARRDAPGKAGADAMLAAVGALASQAGARWNALHASLDAALAPYGLQAEQGTAERNAADEQGRAWQRAVLAFDARVQAAREACEALAPGASCDALGAEAAALEADAAAMPPVQRARARLLTAAVRLQEGDVAACRAALDGAAAFVLRGRPPAPEHFADAGERQVYLDAAWIRLKAAGSANDTEGALAACLDAVALVEALRARVSDPYQQSAFLDSVAWAYDYAVAVARRLERWDAMLAVMDAAKAEGALRRGAPPDADALGTLRAVDADPDPARRARRWSLYQIERARRVPAPAPLTLAALQGALDADEAVLAYYWIAADVLVVAAVDRAGIDVARVAVPAPDLVKLEKYAAALALGQPNTNVERVFFRPFGDLLLPAACRARLADKRRLVVSPHRALHLFPFHAADWEGEPLIERFAVRYAPNLRSLLLPWAGPTLAAGARAVAVGCGSFVGPNAPPLLADAEPEAQEVGAAYAARGRPVRVLTGGAVTRDGLGAADLPGAAVVHLATHARSVLAGDAADAPVATRLHLRDAALDGVGVAALGVRAEVVVLAACNSGQRAVAGRGLARLPGDDVFGLQAVLFGSGVRCVVGALWPVSSEPARPLMRRLHEGLAAGEPPDVALQQAVRAHRAAPGAWGGAAYWAPFFVSALGSAAADPAGSAGAARAPLATAAAPAAAPPPDASSPPPPADA